jgi:hypothetical protein
MNTEDFMRLTGITISENTKIVICETTYQIGKVSGNSIFMERDGEVFCYLFSTLYAMFLSDLITY